MICRLRLKRGLFITLFLLSAGVLMASPAAAVVQADHIPWSGWWWPALYGGLATGLDYRGHPAPTEKYELFATGGASTSLSDWYMARYYDPDAEGWVGACGAWSRAALLEAYEILPSSHDNIVFRVGDKKGLLTLCHDSGDLLSASGTPVNLHFWLLDYIGDKRQGFTADLSLGAEVWYHPIYAYEMDKQRSGSTENVTVEIYYANDKVNPDFIGTDSRTKTYTYRLYLNAGGEIIDGEWTGSSKDAHPDILSYPIDTEPRCPYIDCDILREITRSKDDFLESEGNTPVPLNPGTYHLVLLDEDHYILDGAPGNEVYITVKREDGSWTEMDMEIFDNADNRVFSRTLEREEEFSYRKVLRDPPYTLSFTQADYSDPNIYTLSLDRLTSYRQQVPIIPTNGMWSGFTITNTQAEPVEDLMLVTRTEDYRPLQTVYGPVDVAANEKKIFLFENLPFRQYEFADNESLTLMARQPVKLINLFAFFQEAMGGFVQDEAVGTHLIIPDILDPEAREPRSMTGAILNESFVDAPVAFKLYSEAGELTAEFTDTVPAGGKLSIKPGKGPFSDVPNNGWVDVVSTDGGKVSGYQKINDGRGDLAAMETLFALPAASSSAKIVPHITEPLPCLWTTHLTLINPNDESNPVTLHLGRAGDDRTSDLTVELAPHEKRLIDLTGEFGCFPGDALYHSVLRINGQHPIVGHYTYEYAYGDVATYPLLDPADLDDEIVLPHYPSPDGWWTGVHICNPNNFPVEILVEPYDDTGAIINGMVDTFNLDAGSYDAFTVLSFFDGFFSPVSDICFIKFRSLAPEGAPLGGAYIYGNKINGAGRMDSIGGANM